MRFCPAAGISALSILELDPYLESGLPLLEYICYLLIVDFDLYNLNFRIYAVSPAISLFLDSSSTAVLNFSSSSSSGISIKSLSSLSAE